MPYTLKKTLRLILAKGNDYLIQVKANQKRLRAQLEAIAAHRAVWKSGKSPTEVARGRVEHRQVSLFHAHGLESEKWPGVRTVVVMERWGLRQGKSYRSRSFYISSMQTTPQQWMKMIRGHWGIENCLHWPKDVLLKEDNSYGRDQNALLNASLFRTISLNLLKLNGFNSVAEALTELANQVNRIFSFLV